MSIPHRLAAAEWTCKMCGADLQAACDPLQANCGGIGPELVTRRLEHAGATLLAMRTRSPYPAAYRCALPDVLRDIYDIWDWKEPAGTQYDNRPAIPSAAAVTSMEATMAWLQYIPQARHIVRRIVAVRCLTNPTTGRHIVHWRKLGEMLHCSHEAARNWHGQGITMIVDRLTHPLTTLTK
jgi:hypothetical protein